MGGGGINRSEFSFLLDIEHLISSTNKFITFTVNKAPMTFSYFTLNNHMVENLYKSLLTNIYVWLLVFEYCTDIRTVTPNISQFLTASQKF